MKFGFPSKLLAERELYFYIRAWRSINCLVPFTIVRLVTGEREREVACASHDLHVRSYIGEVGKGVELGFCIPKSYHDDTIYWYHIGCNYQLI